MPKKLLALGLLLMSFAVAHAQDFLIEPTTNPQLFPKGLEFNRDKLFYQDDSVVYEFETMELPFVDDFTADHFPPLIKDPANDPRVIDSMFYAILMINGDVYTDDEGFVAQTTYTYTIGSSGDTLTTVENPFSLIQFFDLRTYPPPLQVLTVYPPYNITDSSGVIDTTFLEPTLEQDSILYYIVDLDSSSFYVDRFAYRNSTMGFYPPSYGVVTMDGLNQYGLPYNFDDISSTGNADRLTSVPINLDSTSDSTYFSFFYQAKGFALDGPNREDSLSLEFYNSNTQRWGLIWQIEGIDPTTPVDSFRQVILQVDSQYRTGEFQFRFRNKARLNGAYDHWHIDYIVLDDNRKRTDTAKKDIAFVYNDISMLVDYEAMPPWHFVTDPANYLVDSIFPEVRNNFNTGLNVFNKVVVRDVIRDDGNPPPWVFPGLGSFQSIDPFGYLKLNYLMAFDYPTTGIDTIGDLVGTCDIGFRPAPIEEKDFIRANDTIQTLVRLRDYYAYDDGTAEAGYGVNTGSQGGVTSYLAVRFDMPFRDTIGGVNMYFLPQANDIRSQPFYLTVWSSLSPPTVIFEKEVKTNAIYDEKDGYISYFFDSLVIAGPTFYVGYRKIGQRSMNLGYDLNKNHKNKISWSLDGINWSAPSSGIRDGSVMIRPILRKKTYGVGMDEAKLKEKEQKLVAYPNPTSDYFYLGGVDNLQSLQLISYDGRLVKEYRSADQQYSTAGVAKGIYILQAIDRKGNTFTTKLMINR